MTREEREDAIKFFEDVAKKEVGNARYSKLAIEALKQEPCEDAISRQAVIEAILTKPAWHNSEGSWYHSSDIRDALNELPSAQPEIIRCKDCKHYQFADNRAFGMPVKMCEWFGFEDVDEDDFCSRAERRTG